MFSLSLSLPYSRAAGAAVKNYEGDACRLKESVCIPSTSFRERSSAGTTKMRWDARRALAPLLLLLLMLLFDLANLTEALLEAKGRLRANALALGALCNVRVVLLCVFCRG